MSTDEPMARLTGVRDRIAEAVREKVALGLAESYALVEGGVPEDLVGSVTEAVLDAMGLGPDPEPEPWPPVAGEPGSEEPGES